MNKPNGRCITGGENSRFRDSVETSRCRTQAAIGDIAHVPLLRIVMPPFPIKTVFFSQKLIKLPPPRPFDSPQLLHTSWCRRLFVETKSIHFPHHPQTSLIIERKLCLVKQPIRPRPAWLPRGIHPHPCFTNPHQQTPHPRCRRHCR